MPERLIGRRTLLVGTGAAVALAGLGGCTDDTVGSPPIAARPRSRDESTVDLLAANKSRLIELYAAVTTRHPGLTPDLAGFVRRHRDHLAALTRPAPVTATTTPPGSPRQAAATLDTAADVAGLASAEAAAGRGRMLLVTPVESRLLATLIASIGACESAQAVLLGGTAPASRQEAWPTGGLSATEVDALQTALAAEHAAIYGYGVAGAHLAGVDRDAAAVAHGNHRHYRDQLTEAIRRSGASPQPAAPAYELPFDVVSAPSARRLAAHVEEGIGRAYAGVVMSANTDELRLAGARLLGSATVRRTEWGGALAAFPGLTGRSLGSADG